MKTKLLIDGDIVAYRSSSSAEVTYYQGVDGNRYRYKKDIPEGLEYEKGSILLTELDLFYYIHRILFFCRDYTEGEIIIFLTGKYNYRNDVADDYKGNRKDLSRPFYLDLARDYLANNYRTIVSYNCEADDLMGEWSDDNSIIVTLDKDLEMIPTRHCSNLNPLMCYTMSEFRSFKWFCLQCLTGDSVDNIKGLHRVGKKTAEKILDVVEEGDLKGLWTEVVLAYKERDELDRLHTVAMLIWIARPNYRFYYDYLLEKVLCY